VKGEELPKLAEILDNPSTKWQAVSVKWYDGIEQNMEVASGTGVWYRIGLSVPPIRWVLSRDPQGSVCALLAAKDHINIFLYDGGIVPDPEAIITGGHNNKTARTVAV
jgi:hypothetical protein